MTAVLLTNLAVAVTLMFVMWIISIPLKNAAVIDLAWGVGFALIAWTTFGLASAPRIYGVENGTAPSAWLLPVLTSIWGLRLSAYLGWRNWGQPEDQRYAAMREKRASDFWWKSLFIVFLLQAALLWIVSLPLQFGIPDSRSGWTWLHVLGLLLYFTGLFFEAVADWQLARFKSHPENRGKILDRGLWRYTRHPNYFGDFCVWWGLYLVSIAHFRHLWTIISPILMTVLLMRVSGVTLLEQSLSRKPDFADYSRRTSAFFPLPRKPEH